MVPKTYEFSGCSVISLPFSFKPISMRDLVAGFVTVNFLYGSRGKKLDSTLIKKSLRLNTENTLIFLKNP